MEHQTTKPSRVNTDILLPPFLSLSLPHTPHPRPHTQFKEETCPKGTSFKAHPPSNTRRKQVALTHYNDADVRDTHPTPTAEVSAQQHHQRQQQQHVKQSKSTRTHHYKQAAANTATNTSPSPCGVHAFMEHETTKPSLSRVNTDVLLPPFLSSPHATPTPTHAVQGRNVSQSYKLQSTSTKAQTCGTYPLH